MKCPKCGSETYELTDKTGTVIFCEDLMCDWNSKNPTHQQRLDKVLAKFSLTNDGKTYEITDNSVVFDIDYIEKENKFYMVYGAFDITNNNEWQETMKPISLDTVEHLIADMEAQDE